MNIVRTNVMKIVGIDQVKDVQHNMPGSNLKGQ